MWFDLLGARNMIYNKILSQFLKLFKDYSRLTLLTFKF